MTEHDDIRAKAQEVLRLHEFCGVASPRGVAGALSVIENAAPTLARWILARLDEPRSAGVSHAAARKALPIERCHPGDVIYDYIAQHAELERRARELCEAEYALRKLGRQRYGGTPVDNGTMNDAKALRTAAIDALAELLGERS
jgi:hypothetical protein